MTAAWARKTGLPAGIPVAVGAFDAHLGAVGCGIAPGTLVKIIGTSTCDIAIAPNDEKLADIPGLCGIVGWQRPAGLLRVGGGPVGGGRYFQLVCQLHQAGRREGRLARAVDRAAAKLKPGESGLLALDWNNGNRTVLVDQRLTGLLLGQSLYTTPAEIYRALIEATAFGALTIINRFEEYGVKIAPDHQLRRHCRKKSARHANLRRRDRPADEDFALGANLRVGRGHGGGSGGRRASGFRLGQQSDVRLKPRVFEPNAGAHAVYRELFRFTANCMTPSARPMARKSSSMKQLIDIRDRARS